MRLSSKTFFACKWVFVFCILSLWTYFVLADFSYDSQDAVYIIQPYEQQSLDSVSKHAQLPSLPLYIDDGNGNIQKANSFDALSFLFTRNFSIEQSLDVIPADTCSIRAEGSGNKVTFYLPQPNAVSSTGYFSFIKDNIPTTVPFSIYEVLESSLSRLILNVTSKGDGVGIIILDKTSETISIIFSDPNFLAEDMLIIFRNGCFNQLKEFYIMNDEGILEERRSIGEVRQILNEHPAFEGNFENLRRLEKSYWTLILPDGLIS
jgi:hypothetical protein